MHNANALYNECVVNPNITTLQLYFKLLFEFFYKFIPTSTHKNINPLSFQTISSGNYFIFTYKFFINRTFRCL